MDVMASSAAAKCSQDLMTPPEPSLETVHVLQHIRQARRRCRGHAMNGVGSNWKVELYQELGKRRRRLRVSDGGMPPPRRQQQTDSFRFYLPSMNVWCDIKVADAVVLH